MRRRMLSLAVLLVVALLAAAPIRADGPGAVTGGVRYQMELYAPYPTIIWVPGAAEFSVQETEPWTDDDGVVHNAAGQVVVRALIPNGLWLRDEATCMQYGEDEQGRYVVIASKVVAERGFGPETLGLTCVHKLYDNGTPGADGDLFGYSAGDAFPCWTYDPVCTVPGDWMNGVPYQYPVEAGNLQIHE